MSDESCILLVVAPFYDNITDQLIAGAQKVLQGQHYHTEIISVPGALEIPGAIMMSEQCHRFQGYVALGCVIRGETSHYETVCNESARGIMDLTLHYKLAVGNGIITVENEEQAYARSSPDNKNKGGEAAKACMGLVKLRQKWQKQSAFQGDAHHIKLAQSAIPHE